MVTCGKNTIRFVFLFGYGDQTLVDSLGAGNDLQDRDQRSVLVKVKINSQDDKLKLFILLS